jgi:hypothetical protein
VCTELIWLGIGRSGWFVWSTEQALDSMQGKTGLEPRSGHMYEKQLLVNV